MRQTLLTRVCKHIVSNGILSFMSHCGPDDSDYEYYRIPDGCHGATGEPVRVPNPGSGHCYTDTGRLIKIPKNRRSGHC